MLRYFIFLLSITSICVYADNLQFYIKQLKSPQLSKNIEAVNGLGQLQTKEAFVALVGALPKLNTKVVEAAMRVLGEWHSGDDKSKDAVLKVLIKNLLNRRQNHTVRVQAALALGKIGAANRQDGSRNAQRRLKKATQALARAYKGRVHHSIRLAIIKAIAAIGEPKNIKYITRGLKDKYQGVRAAAVQAFKTLNAGDYVKHLIEYFRRETYRTVRRELIPTIYELNKEKALSFLIRTMKYRMYEGEMRRTAAKLLGTYGGTKQESKAIKALSSSYVKERDQKLRMQILKSIVKYDWDNKDVQKVVENAKKDNPRIQEVVRDIVIKRN